MYTPLKAWPSALSLVFLARFASAGVDYGRMGILGVAGTFTGFDFVGDSTPPLDPLAASLLSRSPEGALSFVAATNPGGSISSACSMNGVYYIGGSFQSLANISANNVAFYSPLSGPIAALGTNGPNGSVNAVYCDPSNEVVWVGGQFSSPSSSVAVWNARSNSWSAPPFKGLRGGVSSIIPNAAHTSILFSGSFSTSFSGGAINITNNPNVPYSPGASPFSSSLVPIPLQVAEVVAAPSSTDPQFSSIQAILCPAGPDGPGNTWLAGSGNTASVTIRTFSEMSVYGVRLGNTLLSGPDTTYFSVVSIPDNKVPSLTYVDPSTGQNATCTSSCPLSRDPSIPYQDFLFQAPISLTGMQIFFSGVSMGLHILQLLSSGAFASAISSQNAQSCFAPNPSNVTMTGTWLPKNANTNIPATLQTVLVSTVSVGTPASAAPTFTWRPCVSAAGEYNAYLLIPSCVDSEDCPLRTSVRVTVFPGGGSQPFVTTVSQRVQGDVKVLIYSGLIDPSSSSSVTTVTMSLADQPTGGGLNGQYELVAGNVELVLTSANVTSASPGVAGNGSTTLGTQHGFGIFEWSLTSTTHVDATSILPNTSETAADTMGVDFFNALGANAPSAYISAAVQHPSGTIFAGGSFTFATGPLNGTANIVAYKQGSLFSLSNGGLNGAVVSLALYGDQLYIGGSFSDTESPSTQGQLRGVAMYNVQTNSWNTLGAGVNGVVTSIALINAILQVVGNFSETFPKTGIHSRVVGFATWDITSSSWVNSGGFVEGNFTFVNNGTSSNGQYQLLAGNLQGFAQFGATGMVLLSNNDSHDATVTPMGVQLDSSANTSTSTSATRKRHNHFGRSPTAWFSHIKPPALSRRQASVGSSTLPPLPPTPAPAVLAGAFWSNESSSHEVAIIGGNFTFSGSGSSANSQAVAIYDTVTSTATALSGDQISGVVRALYVMDTKGYLCVGGVFNLTSANANGFAIYDLVGQQWLSTIAQPLQAHSGSSVVVRYIATSSYKPNTLIVAGSFAQAGTVACQGVCLFDTILNQWSPLGYGLQGDISSVALAGRNQEVLIAGGVITLADGTSANVAQYSFTNNSWAAVGDPTVIPGPVTAVEVDNGNSSSIFAAGRAVDGSSSFIIFWNGISWFNVGSAFEANSNISQLLMVPLQSTHSPNSIVEPDRALMISGSLSFESDSASVVIFDGATFTPYINCTSTEGTLGYVSSLFYSIANFSFGRRSFLATGIVILISIAIAAGVVFLLALIGILWTLLSRRDDKLTRYENEEDDEDSIQHRPSSLLEHINAATRSTILGAQSPFNQVSAEKEEAAGEGTAEGDPFGPDASNYLRAATPSDAMIGTMVGEEESSRPAHARYSFDGTGEGELPLTAGMEIEVLDDRDNAWWYARNPQTGQEGVVPASYLY